MLHTFLYVDADPLRREQMALLISSLSNARFIAFEPCPDFIERCEKATPCPDILLLNVDRLYDGVVMLDYLRSHPRFASKITIAVTGKQVSHDQLEAIGFDGILTRPISVDEFAAQVQRIIDSSNPWIARVSLAA